MTLPLLKRSGKAKIRHLTFWRVVNLSQILRFIYNLDSIPVWVENCSMKKCWLAAPNNCWYENQNGIWVSILVRAKTLHKKAHILPCCNKFSNNILSNIAFLPAAVQIQSRFQGCAWILWSLNVCAPVGGEKDTLWRLEEQGVYHVGGKKR